MTDQVKDQEIELEADENEVAEAHDPENAPKQAKDAADKAGDVTKQAPKRPGDKDGGDKKADKVKKPAGQDGKEVDADPNSNVKVEKFDHKKELDELVESEATLSDEFKEKTSVIFEAALTAKLAEETDRLEAEYAERFEEEMKTITDNLVEKIDGYLNYVVENWMAENKVAVENGLRTEIAETFMTNLKNLFIESYIEVPESKVDLVDELATTVEELEEKLNMNIANSLELIEKNEQLEREKVLSEASVELADTEKAKLVKLTENIEFEDVETFKTKVDIIKESYFSAKSSEPHTDMNDVADADEIEEVTVSPQMETYVSALKKINK